MDIYLLSHYSIIPLFQHSNWGEAPKFYLEPPAMLMFLALLCGQGSAFWYLSPASLEPAEITEVDFFLCLIFWEEKSGKTIILRRGHKKWATVVLGWIRTKDNPEGFDQNPPLKDSGQKTLWLCELCERYGALSGSIPSHPFYGW